MRSEKPEIRLKDIYALLPRHELVSLRVKTNTGYYDEIPHLVYEGLPFDRTIAIVDKIEARGTECIEITIRENRVTTDDYNECKRNTFAAPCEHQDCSNRNSLGYCTTTVCINEQYKQEQWGKR